MFKKVAIMSIAAVGAMSLISTGFAGWVIAKSAHEFVQGNVISYTADPESVGLTVTADKDNITFGKPANTTPAATDWFYFDSTVTEENLVVNFTITIANIPEGKTAYVGYKFELPTIGSGLATHTVSGDASADSATNWVQMTSAGSKTITLTYEWGSAFGGTNPYTYYNTMDYSDTLAETAEQNLDSLAAAATGQFRLKVVASTVQLKDSAFNDANFDGLNS